MSLQTKIKLSVSSDWKTITITDTTGSGIAGYGSNQDPVGYREASGVGTDIKTTRIVLTSPSGSDTAIDLNSTNAYTAVTSGYQITNVALGYAVDEAIEEGIWKVSYTPYFANASGVNISLAAASATVGFNSAYRTSFLGATKLKLGVLGTPTYFDITSVGLASLVISDVSGITDASYTYDKYHVGYEAVQYIPIVQTIKDCLDSKVAALPESTCPCKEKQVNTLMNNYVLYDAMFINAANNNLAKADYIYDILSNYCSESDCKCNG